MIGLLVITHETIGQAYETLAEHFFGTMPEHLRILGVNKEAPLETTINNANTMIQEVQQKDGVLVLTDIFGATPCNVAQRLAQSSQVAVVTGLNAPMMVKALQYAKDRDNLDSFAEEVIDAGIKGIIRVECERD